MYQTLSKFITKELIINTCLSLCHQKDIELVCYKSAFTPTFHNLLLSNVCYVTSLSVGY